VTRCSNASRARHQGSTFFVSLPDLRHTGATLMLRQGTHMKIVQERLGHGDISMTMDLNSHVAQDLQESAALNLEAHLTGRRKKDAEVPVA
jgi:integrase